MAVQRQTVNLRLGEFRIPKASDILANRLRDSILSDDVKEGSALPSERDLVLQLGASRTTVREALRILELEGLISVKPGPKGGATVRRPTYQQVSRSLALLLRAERVSFVQLLEARRIVEGDCARLAAQNATADDRQLLDDSVEAMEAALNDYPAFFAENIKFHHLLSAATHNFIMRVFMRSVREIVYERIVRVDLTLEQRQAGVKACRAIVEAIGQKDSDLAERRAVKHIRAFEDHLASVYGEVFWESPQFTAR